MHYHFCLRERFTINLIQLQSALTGVGQIPNKYFNHPPDVVQMKSIKGSLINRKSCAQLVVETYVRSLWRGIYIYIFFSSSFIGMLGYMFIVSFFCVGFSHVFCYLYIFIQNSCRAYEPQAAHREEKLVVIYKQRCCILTLRIWTEVLILREFFHTESWTVSFVYRVFVFTDLWMYDLLCNCFDFEKGKVAVL